MRIRSAPRFVDLTTADINLGHFKLPNLERALATIKPLPSPQEEPVRNKTLPVVVSASLDIEQKSPPEPATGLRRILALWPWAWLAFAGAATLAWAIALGWAAFALVRWIVA